MKTRLMAFALATLAASVAMATQVSVLYTGGLYKGGGSFAFSGGSAPAGLINNSYSPGWGTSGLGTTLYAYCLSPGTIIGSGANPWDANQNAANNQIGWLAGRYWTGTYAGLTNEQAAAVQVAIWMVQLGGTNTVTGNDAWSTLRVGEASTLYTQSINMTGMSLEYIQRVPGQSQDLVEAVPEPFTMALGLAGLGAAIARRRKAR